MSFRNVDCGTKGLASQAFRPDASYVRPKRNMHILGLRKNASIETKEHSLGDVLTED